MKFKRLSKSIIIMMICISMILISSVSVFAFTTGSGGNDKTYNTTSYFMIDGTNYTCPQTLFSDRDYYNKSGSTYYILDVCGLIQKNSSGTARNFGVKVTTTKRTSDASIYRLNPFASAISDILYNASGTITCELIPHSYFPFGTFTNTATGTNSYCEVYQGYEYDSKCHLEGTVKCYKPYTSGTGTISVGSF